MVRSCDILNCGNNLKKTTGIRYHELPSDLERKTQWLNAIDANCGFKDRTLRNRKNTNIIGKTYDNTFVCQSHFEETCYEPNSSRLKSSAIPTKFPTLAVFEPPETRKRKLESCTVEEISEDSPTKKRRQGKKRLF